MLEELTSLTLEHFSALVHRSEELHQLRTILQDIELAGSGDDDRQLLAERIRALIERCGVTR